MSAQDQNGKAFHTDKRIRLGVWGLGRGLSFLQACEALNIDVVAGCDYNAHMRERFGSLCPGAYITEDAEAFLAADFDAVLLATFCPAHAKDAIRCLKAGKHVLSEVTAFHTMAEGVELVEAVRQSGLVYNLAENYPFIAPFTWLAQRWRKGLFGELQYAEGEYVHEVRSLAYTYIDGVPIEPGYAAHNWRSWLHFHYYCTHSLGPIMVVCGVRPVRVVSLPGNIQLAGFPAIRGGSLGSIAPSLITMDNGAVVKNLMGGTTNDTHLFRFWGTRGSAEVEGDKVHLRLGAGGSTPKHAIHADWGELSEIARRCGHGGGDFWVLYYFARQLLYGDPAPFDIYNAADVTIPGILAYRSGLEGGKPYDIPDFRDPAALEAWRGDTWAQPHPEPAVVSFPETAHNADTAQFNEIIKKLIEHMHLIRSYMDWSVVAEDLIEPESIAPMKEKLLQQLPDIRENTAKARALAEAYPGTNGARALLELLELATVEEAAAMLEAGR